MSVKSQHVVKSASALVGSAARRRVTSGSGFAGNHTVMRKLSETSDKFRAQANGVTAGLSEVKRPLLQRKCACGGSGGQCEACEEEKARTLQCAQMKLAVSQPGDRYEQEADRIANQVLSAPAPSSVSDTTPKIQRVAGQLVSRLNNSLAMVDGGLSSPGRQLDTALKSDMEHRFNRDFSAVRVHTGPSAERSARAVDAQAYTVGHNIVFGAGQFSRTTSNGRRLIAHELTHVVQQSGSSSSVSRGHEQKSLTPIAASPIQIARGPNSDKDKVPIHADAKAFLEDKLRQFYELLTRRERIRLKRDSTIAIGMATVDGEPRLVYTVANNKTSKQIRAAADELHLHRWTYDTGVKGRGDVGAPNDAEQLMGEFARDNRIELHGIVVSRRVCKDCSTAIPTYNKGQIQVSVIQDPIEIPPRVSSLKPPAKTVSGGFTAKTPPADPGESAPAKTVIVTPVVTTSKVDTAKVTQTVKSTANIRQGGITTKITATKPNLTVSGMSGSRRSFAHVGGSRIGGGAVMGGIVAGAAVIAVPLIKQWFAKNYLEKKWAAEAQAMMVRAIESRQAEYDALIKSHLSEIQKYQAEGRQVSIRLNVDVNWVDTDFGPALTKAEVATYELLIEDGPPPKPYKRDLPGGSVGGCVRSQSNARLESQVIDLPLEGTDVAAASQRLDRKIIELKLYEKTQVQQVEFEYLIIQALEMNTPLDSLRDYAAYRRKLGEDSPGAGYGFSEITQWSSMERLIDGPMEDLIAAAKKKKISLEFLRSISLYRSRTKEEGGAGFEPAVAEHWAEVVRLIDNAK